MNVNNDANNRNDNNGSRLAHKQRTNEYDPEKHTPMDEATVKLLLES